MSFIQKVILITIFKEVNLTTDKLKRENGNLTPLPNVFHFTLPGILVHKFSLNIIVSEKKKEGALFIILSYGNSLKIKDINSVILS